MDPVVIGSQDQFNRILSGAAEVVASRPLRLLRARPLGSNLFVLPARAVERTSGGIVIPQTDDPTGPRRPAGGTVLAVGPGARNRKGVRVRPDLNVGDRIVFSRFAGIPLTVDGVDILVVPQAVVEGVLAPGAVMEAYGEL